MAEIGERPGAVRQVFQLRTSLYAKHLGIWERVFPCQIFVVTTEEFKAAPLAVTNRVLAWLGLPSVDLSDRIETTARGFQTLKGRQSKGRRAG